MNTWSAYEGKPAMSESQMPVSARNGAEQIDQWFKRLYLTDAMFHQGADAIRLRIEAMIQEHAREAQDLWEAKRDSASASERWESEYWRGQMNGLHHLLTAILEMGAE